MPIPGTKRRKYLEENAAAAEVKFSSEDLRRIDEEFPAAAAPGGRYPEHMITRHEAALEKSTHQHAKTGRTRQFTEILSIGRNYTIGLNPMKAITI